ncbi:hypothetical protein TBLA_0A03770 [Henningerozyma blattae CBS 6284]|uniref:Peptidase M20 dimerisation domain-containing protein n=1 Tax=Henningerozyma blattae (strain ATCC 34711 / CBS 6284 / DSM 70876 / NBRC 10599 / NRRL Y-10934 / UCD 77-7) TaxID=1071380 RepID=I2GVM3_HENB6|nr:hypothetical protein TBLA_0A03770 [Tetrapisispora blattae CBS 6284]CCH58175.1 hypothetical protein TBLA_0A03770 [Tetrapisispora blattae CBS 6284]
MIEKNHVYKRKKNNIFSLTLLLFLVALFFIYNRTPFSNTNTLYEPFKCPAYDLIIGNDPTHIADNLIYNNSLRNDTIRKLSNLVKIPTEIYDDFNNPSQVWDDPNWEPFKRLHEQLEIDFPLIWSNLQIEKINNFSILITWQGTITDLRPIMFAAHQDVVPVVRETWSNWKYPPFSGHFDGQYLWGRGAFDDKNMLVGILQSLEYMLSSEPDFQPSRTIIVALGFDEEASGRYGAKYLNDVLLKRYGQYGIYSIMDEGVLGLRTVEDVLVASPSIGEKGYLNLNIDINTPGGHSSVPPDHTSIGIASTLIHEMELNKFDPTFTPINPMSTFYQCVAEYSPTMDSNLKFDFANAFNNEKSNANVLNYLVNTDRKIEYLFRTSKAFDMINGGVKANALPEYVSILLNSRISVDSSLNVTLTNFINHAESVAKHYDLGLIFEDKILLEKTESGYINMTIAVGFEPAPISPNNEVWKEFASTIKGFYQKIVLPRKFNDSNTELVITPSIMPANTDTAKYWNLTRNIYRFQPGFTDEETMLSIHSVNERVDIDIVMEVIGFVYDYILVSNNNDIK